MASVSWIVCAVSYKSFGITFHLEPLECLCTSAPENCDCSSPGIQLAFSCQPSDVHDEQVFEDIVFYAVIIFSWISFSVKGSTKESAPFALPSEMAAPSTIFADVSEVVKSIVVIFFIIFTVKTQPLISTSGLQHRSVIISNIARLDLMKQALAVFILQCAEERHF